MIVTIAASLTDLDPAMVTQGNIGDAKVQTRRSVRRAAAPFKFP